MTYNNFHGHKKAWGGLYRIPVEDTFVVDSYTRMSILKFLLLQLHEALAYLDDVVACSLVDIGVVFLEQIENIHGQRSITRTNFVYYEILVWEVL